MISSTSPQNRIRNAATLRLSKLVPTGCFWAVMILVVGFLFPTFRAWAQVTNTNSITNGGLIAPGTTVLITNQISTNGQTYTTSNITINGAITNNGTLLFVASNRISVNEFYPYPSISGTGNLDVENSNAVVYLAASNSYIGGTTIGSGTIVAGNNTALGATNGALVDNGTLNLSNASVSVGSLSGNGIITSSLGSGTLIVGAGGASSVFNGSFGSAYPYLSGAGLVKVGSGTLSLTGFGTNGPSSTIADGGVLLESGFLMSDVTVGFSNNNAVFVVTNGGNLYGTNGFLGGNLSSSNITNISTGNSVVVSGSNSSWRLGALYNGYVGGSNSVTIQSGGLISDLTAYVGYAPASSNFGGVSMGPYTPYGASSNSVIVTGNGSLWSNTYDLFLGYGGSNNSMTISAGGKVINGNGWIGYTNSSSGNLVTVDGGGLTNQGTNSSSWINNGNLMIGSLSGIGTNGGSNTLIITNGGFVSDYYGTVGSNSSRNLVIVSGSNSLWSNAAQLTIGIGGGGNSSGNMLIISNGGRVSDTVGLLAYQYINSSNNMVLITGSNSLWTNSQYLSVGVSNSSGGNSVTIANGGTLGTATTNFIGSNSQLNIGALGGSDSAGTVTGGIYLQSGGVLDFNQTNSATFSNGITLSPNAFINQFGIGTTTLANPINGIGSVNVSAGRLNLMASSYAITSTITGGTEFINGSNNVSGFNNLTFKGTGAFIYDNTNVTGTRTETINLNPVAGEATIQLNASANYSETLAITNALTNLPTRSNGAVVNFVVSGPYASNAAIRIVQGTTNSAVNSGEFYNGTNYAYISSNGVIRGINYGSDTGTAISTNGSSLSASQIILTYTTNPTTHVVTTNSVTNSNVNLNWLVNSNITNQTSVSLNTLNLASNVTSVTLYANDAVIGVNSILDVSTSTNLTISGGSSMGVTNAGGEFSVRVNSPSNTLTIATPIWGSNNNFALVKSGLGTLTLTASELYTGATYIDSGTLQLMNLGRLGGGTYTNSIIDFGTLLINGNSQQGLGGSLTGTGNLIVTNSTIVTLSSSNSYSGGTIVANNGVGSVASRIQLGNNYALGSTNGSLLNNGYVDLYGHSVTIGTLNGTGIILNSTGVGNVTVGSGNSSSTFNGTLGNWTAIGLNKIGQGTFTLASSNNLSFVNISSGTLQLSSYIPLGYNTNLYITNNGTIVVNGANGSTLINGGISGTGALIKTGSNALVLNGSNSYTGGTTIGSGTIVAGNNYALGVSNGGLVDNGILNLSNNSVSIGTLSGTGTITSTAGIGSLSVGAGGASSTFAGAFMPSGGGGGVSISSGVSLIKVGVGTLSLTGGTNVIASTIVDGGTLQINRALGGEVTVGMSNSGAILLLTNGGSIWGTNGFLGCNIDSAFSTNLSSGNSAIVSGSNSSWNLGGSLNVGYSGGSNNVTIASGGLVADSNGFVDGANSSGNMFLVTGSNSLWSNSSSLTVGSSGYSNSLVVSNGGSVVVGNNYSGTNGGIIIGANLGSSNNSIVVTGLGSSLSNNSGVFTVGGFGSGNSLIISNGGNVISSGYLMYDAAGLSVSTNGSVFVTGDNSSLIASNGIAVASGGVIFASNGGSVSGNSIMVGSNYGGGGMITVAQGGTMAAGTITLGSSSSTLNLGTFGGSDTGVTLSASNINVGMGSINFNQSDLLSNASAIYGNGSINQLGIGTTILTGSNNTISWLNNSLVTMVNAGTLEVTGVLRSQYDTEIVKGGGTLIITNGGLVSGFSSWIGDNPYSLTNGLIGNLTSPNGAVAIVSGSNSLWSNTGSLTVGNMGSSNSVQVANGGTLTASFLEIGNNGSSNSLVISNRGRVLVNNYSGSGIVLGSNYSASNNMIVVTGAGSSLSNNSSTFTVGANGSRNSLIVSNGGTVTMTRNNSSTWPNGLLIGSNSSASNNSVVVTGEGSMLNLSNNNLTLNYNSYYGFGNNTLVISNGGTVLDGWAQITGSASNTTVLVTGARSLWSNNGINLNNSYPYSTGSNTPYTLVVSNGGSVVSAGYSMYGLSGVNIDYGASAIVTGTNSSLIASNGLTIGNYNSGTLVVSNGGSVYGSTIGIGTNSGRATIIVAQGGNLGAGTIGVGYPSTLNLGTYGGSDTGISLVASNINLGGVMNFNQSDTLSNASAITGYGSINQLGTGTTVLSGNSGNGWITTTVNAGNLRVTGVLSTNGVITVNNAGTLSGTGSIGNVTVNAGGTIAPGANNLPGTLSLQSSIWAPGGNYNWVLADATGSAGTGYSTLSLASTLDLSQLSWSNQFNINLTSLALNGVAGAATNFNPSNNYSWTLLTASNGIAGFAINDFLIYTNEFANTNGGTFGVSTNGNELDLTYTAPTSSVDTNSSNQPISDPFTNGLVLYYPFNGDFIDYSGSGNDLTNFTDGIALASDRFGNMNSALYLSSSTDSAQSISPIGIAGNTSRTLSLWVQASTTNPGDLISFGSSATNGGALSLLYGDGNISAWGNFSDLTAYNQVNPLVNTWHHVVYVYSGSVSGAQIYLDGNLLQSTPIGSNLTDVLNTDISPLTVGNVSAQYNAPWQQAEGGSSISDIRIYNRALGSNDVAALYALESGNSTLTNLPQTITFPSIPNQTYGVGTITLNGYVSSGLALTYTVPTGSASATNNQLIVTGAGTVTVVAKQLGDGNYAAATPVTNSFVVSQANQFITAPQLPPITYGSGPINLVSSAQPSGLGVIFSVLSGPATISNNVMNITGAGTVTLSESQSGNANYLPASNVTTSFVVGQATQSIASFDPITNQPYPSNAMISITAPAASSALPVALTILSGPASIATTNILLNDAGTVTLAADQSGNSNYLAAKEVTTNITITPVTITNNTLRVQALIAGQSQLLISTQGIAWLNVGPSAVPGASNGTNLPTLLDGYAWYPSWPSLDTNYSYTGSSPNFNGLNLVPFTLGKSLALQVNQGSSNSVSATNIVTNGMNATLVSFNSPSNSVAVNYDVLVSIILTNSQTISFGALAPMVFGASPINLAATSSSTLPVSYSSSASNVASISGNVLTVMGAGSATITASQAGNNNWSAATPVSQLLILSKASGSVSFGNLNQTYDGTAKSVIVTTAPTNLGVAVSYNGSNSVPTNAGSYAVLGSITNANYSGYGSNTLVVSKASNVITPFSPIGNQSYTTNLMTVSVPTASSGLPVVLSVLSGPATLVGSNTISLTGAGTVVLAADQSGNSNYQAASQVTTSFGVTAGSQSISFGALAPMVYGASPINLAATSSSYLPVSYSSSASNVASISGNVLTVMGAGSATITVSQAGNSNWSAATPVSQLLIVSKASGSVSFGNLNQTYDGTAKLVTVITAPTNLGVAVSYNGSNAVPINAGSYSVVGSITNANYSGYGSNTLVISKASNVITPFSPIGNQSYSTNLMTVSVPTASSGLPVVLSVLSGPATLVGSNTISLTGAGTVVLAADQGGDVNYSAAQEVTTSFSVLLSGAPSWTKPTGQGYVTTIIAQVLDTNGVPVTAPGSMLAAFNGTNVAGVATITNGSSTFGMVVGAQQSSVSGMSYKIFNAQTGQVIPIAESLNFQSLVQQGTVSSPLTLHEVSTQNIPINQGWNWISFNTLPVSNSINTVMANYQAQDNDVIKGVGGSATYFGGTWYPSPSTFTVKSGQMYMLSSQATTTLMVSGVPVASPMTISLSAGWNWIGCPLQSAEPITTFLNAITAVNNDTLLTQGSFETYSAGSWYNFGGDFQFQPGVGFLLYVATPQQISF